MKKYIYILVLGLIVSACTNSEEKTKVISVLDDNTETNFIATPDAGVLLAHFGFDSNLWQSATFRYGRINSLMHNAREQVSIHKEESLLGNELERRQLVADFESKVVTFLNKPKDSIGFKYSSIWLPLVEELKVLQANNESHATLYVFSDLRENSRWFSTYKTSDMKKMHQDFVAVVELFLSKATGISASDNIKVVVVYQPQTIDDDIQFRQLRMLYTELFLSIGISIEFTANLNTSSL